MSKLSFRARQLDSNKALPVYQAEELPDLTEFTTINRAVPQMPTGMEKEEESEHHLQRAISAQQVYGDTQQLVIPTPESEEMKNVPNLYKASFKQPKQYIHVQACGLEEDVPDYDLDSEDEEWLKNFNKKKEMITHLKFEEMIDTLEKGMGAQAMTYNEAKSLLKSSEDLMKPVFEYWSKKRQKLSDPAICLIPQVRAEKRDGTSVSDPYVAFRRRTEKMQTRKNRKNDEAGYERMLKLRRDLKRACTILDMVKRREQTKKDMLALTVEIFEKRYAAGDFTGQILQQCLDLIRYQPPANNLSVPVSSVHGENLTPGSNTEGGKDIEIWKKRKQEERARLHKNDNYYLEAGFKRYKSGRMAHVHSEGQAIFSENEDDLGPLSPTLMELPSEPEEDEDNPDGRFAFKRKKGVKYLPPRFDSPMPYPWSDPSEGGLGDKRFRYSCTSISSPKRLIGFARRRVGRGGRIYFDRAWTPLSENLDDLESLLNASSSSTLNLPNGLFPYDHLTGWKKLTIPHYRPKSPTRTPTSQAELSTSNNHDLNSDVTSSGQPRPRLHRSFSSQPRSKFSLNTSPSNGKVGLNLSTASRHSLPNGPIAGQTQSTLTSYGAWTSNQSGGTPTKSAYSTAPMKAVYALNFPLNSSTSSQLLSNSLVRGNAPFSPTAVNAPGGTNALKSTSLSNISISLSEIESAKTDALHRQNSLDAIEAT
ncbi:predicted protein [Nematostella vectensis]|uniref:Enhancer of polycomb-like protein n=1 Tax=Nematostella vectensis TaxID=45351 RepID=A7RI01_NEMVE|nr:enhancer of polycomb homolog 1 [Nematostella vectensis]EDO48946.1 predicted protein [Nematostella vectensis]|eukprot:XP_001641009.1 predicted protein [Nematostella vectensis]